MSLNEVGIYSSLKLGRDNVPESDWPCLLYLGPKQFGINDSLTVTGNVGIGTATLENPEGWSRILDLLGVTDAKLSVRTAKIDGRVSVHEKGCWGSPAGAMFLGTKTNHALSFGTKAATQMTILGNGNVGIGTITPGAKLEVNGNVKATSFLGDGSNLTGVVKNLDLAVKKAGDTMTGSLTIQNNLTVTGNIGIATTAATTERLEVNGNVKATSFLGDGSNLTGVVKKTGDTMTGALTIQNNLTVNGKMSVSDGVIQKGGNTITTTNDLGLYSQTSNWVRFVTNNAPFKFYSDGGAGTNPIVVLEDNGQLTVTGNIGIGTNIPTKAKVHIEGAISYTQPGGYRFMRRDKVDQIDSFNMPYSLYASGAIIASECHAFSDERIKEIYNRSDSQEDLKTLLQIEVTDYSYKDKIAKGNGKHKKVIGQQIAKVFPQAVSTNTDVVSDILQFATLSEGWVTLTNHGLKTGERVKLIWGEDNSQIFTIEAVTSDTFQIALDYCGDIFVYGREVNDFHVVDYDALSMLDISATQALYKIILTGGQAS